MPYVSITGLTTKRIWHVPIFWRYAIRAMAQAKSASGCLAAEQKIIDGVHHTRSLWRSRRDMIGFLRSGAHQQAVRLFPRIATGKVLGFEAEELPDWDEVHRMWYEQGREV